jgi:hypothetical protein
MLLVAALGFGREVLHWWHGAAAPRSAPIETAGSLGDPAAPHVLEFGDQSWSIRRQPFSGPAEGVAAALQAACRAAIPDARPRGAVADAAELQLLKRLAKERPVVESRGQWRLYQWASGYPVLIGTRAFGEEKAGVGGGSGRTILDETPFRVVIWGIAVPLSSDNWTLYLFLAGERANPQGEGLAKIPLPPGGQRLVAIRAPAGGAVTAFSTKDGAAARGFYDHWFAEQGWKATAAWRQIATGWHARFEIRSGGAERAVDIRLGIDAQGGWSGLVMESETAER